MAPQVVAMEMAEALALNDEEQVLMGTGGTHSISPSPRGTRVLYRLYPLCVLGYPEFPLHGVVCASQALVAAHITQKIEAWRSGQLPSLRAASAPQVPVRPPHSWYLLSAFLVPTICVLGTCYPHSWYLLSAFLVPAIRILGTHYLCPRDLLSAFQRSHRIV
jgi:hypothetical protein